MVGAKENEMKHIHQTMYLALGALAVWVTAGTAWAQAPQGQGQEIGQGAAPQGQPMGQDQDQQMGQPRQAPPSQVTGQLISATATVEKVDAGKREVTLKGSDNTPVIVQVPENVQNLKNIKPGDQVNIDYYQSLALSLKKPGTGSTGVSTESFRQPSSGALPGGMQGQQITATAKIAKIDPSKDSVTIRSPSGEMDTINVSDPQARAELKKLKPGDAIQLTYTEAMAISMKPKK
jgi:Cu/Ag efflux protein CusF